MGCCCPWRKSFAAAPDLVAEVEKLAVVDTDAHLRAMLVARLKAIWEHDRDGREMLENEQEIEQFARSHEKLKTMAARLAAPESAPQVHVIVKNVGVAETADGAEDEDSEEPGSQRLLESDLSDLDMTDVEDDPQTIPSYMYGERTGVYLL